MTQTKRSVKKGKVGLCDNQMHTALIIPLFFFHLANDIKNFEEFRSKTSKKISANKKRKKRREKREEKREMRGLREVFVESRGGVSLRQIRG